MNNQDQSKFEFTPQENDLEKHIALQDIAGDKLLKAIDYYIVFNPQHEHLFKNMQDEINCSKY